MVIDMSALLAVLFNEPARMPLPASRVSRPFQRGRFRQAGRAARALLNVGRGLRPARAESMYVMPGW